MIYYKGVTVSFVRSRYRVNENEGLVQPVLYLSYQSTFDVEVRVRTVSRTAKS